MNIKKPMILGGLLLLLTACGPQTKTEGNAQQSAAPFAGGSYTATAPAYHDSLEVQLEVDDQKQMTALSVVSHQESEGIGTVAVDRLPEAILEGQSLEVEAISGATITSDAIVAAAADALTQAGLDPANFGYRPREVEELRLSPFDPATLAAKAPTTESLTVTDARGREVELELPISRFAVSTMDVMDFVIPLLGEEAFSMLSGSGQDGGRGIETYAQLYVPLVGDYLTHSPQISDHNAPFDLEMILAADPDVLIVNSAMGAHGHAMALEAQLQEAGIPMVLVDVPGDSIYHSSKDTVDLLGRIFQKEERARELNEFLDRQFALVLDKQLQEREDRPTVYYEKSGYSEIFGVTSGDDSGWGSIIALAGGDNIAQPLLAEAPAGPGKGGKNVTLDQEYILQADPEFIILSGSGGGWMDNIPGSEAAVPSFDIIHRKAWDQLSAVKEAQIYEISHPMNRSLTGFYALQKLAATFHPQEFQGVDVDANIDEFFQRFMLVDSDITSWYYRMPKDLTP
ncbi:MAG: ABC transporter substrate-binding protein [Tissierellia bacterium]|nr:ABC transporter substrate-binding protein [Tissierellia bacterium]